MKKLYTILAVLAVTIVTILGAGSASADTVVGPGAKATPAEYPDGACSIAAFGHNNAGDLIALTAGHCAGGLPVGTATYLRPSGQLLGHFTRISYVKDSLSVLDYAVIEVAPGITPSDMAYGIKIDKVGNARTGQPGIAIGSTSGRVNSCFFCLPYPFPHTVLGPEAWRTTHTTAKLAGGDSGGAYLVEGGTKLAGILVRSDPRALVNLRPPFTAQSIQQVIADYGQGFDPV